jgi:hypothetical protein
VLWLRNEGAFRRRPKRWIRMERKDEKTPNLGSSPITLTYIPISSLKLDPRNPRVHSPRQVR